MSLPRDFFIGWAGRLPTAQAWSIRGGVAAAMAAFLLLGLMLARAIDDPGGGTGTGDEVVLEGVLAALPYPTLTLRPAPGGAVRTVMMSGGGKDSAPFDPVLNGQTVQARGYMLRRGALEMLQVTEPIQRAVAAIPAPEVTPLGTWRLTGEICDGKCLAGAMRPGTGIAHRACANLCVTSGVPPVFVATGPVAGQTHMLLGDPEGGPLVPRFRDLTALRVTLEGEVEQRGSLLIFRPDLSRAVVR